VKTPGAGKETTPEPPDETPDKPDAERPFELRPGSAPTVAVPAWALAVVALVLLAVAWYSSRRSAAEITEDSRDFQEALMIWLPWLMAKQGTPRSVKRFVNRLRYIAIRLRKAAGTRKERFPEPNTVALAAIHYLEPRWLTEGAAFERAAAGVLHELIEKDFGAAGGSKTLEQTLTQSAEAYAAWAGEHPSERGTWPPPSGHREAFLAVISEKPEKPV